MANTDNFKSNVNLLSRQYSRFMVSRIFENPLNSMLEVEEPANLPDEFFIEISLYSLSDNSLVYNTTIATNSQTNVLFTRTLQYSGQQVRRLLFVDFSKEQLAIPDGEYQAVVSFFVSEIGTLDEKPLFIHTVSPSRREVELRLLPEYKTQENMNTLLNVSRPQINSSYVMEAVGQIFGKTSGSIPSDNSVLVFDSIEQTLPAGLNNDVILELQEISTDILDTAYEATISQLESDLTSGKVRFTDMYLQDIINTTITDAYTQYLSSSVATTKYTLPDINNT